MTMMFCDGDGQVMENTRLAGSVYKVMVLGWQIRWGHMLIWRCHAPINVKIFVYLVLKERILTHDMMERRGMKCDLPYVVCSTCLIETPLPLLFLCPYAKQVLTRCQV